MSMNKQRRQMMKATTALAASSVALLATPTWVSAASSKAQPTSAHDAIRITVSNVGKQTYVTVDNTSRKPVTLSHILPGVVSDENGTFDLNSLLAKGPITVMPGKPWVSKIHPAQAVKLITPGQVNATQVVHGVKITVATRHTTPVGNTTIETTRTLLA